MDEKIISKRPISGCRETEEPTQGNIKLMPFPEYLLFVARSRVKRTKKVFLDEELNAFVKFIYLRRLLLKVNSRRGMRSEIPGFGDVDDDLKLWRGLGWS